MSFLKTIKTLGVALTRKEPLASQQLTIASDPLADEHLRQLATCEGRSFIDKEGDTARFTFGSEFYTSDVRPVSANPLDLLDARAYLTAAKAYFARLSDKGQTMVRIPSDAVFPAFTAYWEFAQQPRPDRSAFRALVGGQPGFFVHKDTVEIATVLKSYDFLLTEIEKARQAMPNTVTASASVPKLTPA